MADLKPVVSRPTLVNRREGTEWGIAMLHGGREIHWYTIEEALAEADRLRQLAAIASRPGEAPEIHG